MLVSLVLRYNSIEEAQEIYSFVDGQGDCMEIIISHCEKLSKIDENALAHLDLCSVSIEHDLHKVLKLL